MVNVLGQNPASGAREEKEGSWWKEKKGKGKTEAIGG